MEKMATLTLAHCVISKMLDNKKISVAQYIALLDDFQEKLGISEEEYLEIIDSNWTIKKRNT